MRGVSDEFLGATVKIKLGNYKGYIGFVVSVTENEASVQLSANSRVIRVPKTSLMISGKQPTRSRSGISTENSPGITTPWLEGRTPGYGGQTPGYGGQTPGYGGQTPGYGGQTPGYGGQTPGYGGRTPGYGDRTPGYEPDRTPLVTNEIWNPRPHQLGTGTPTNFSQTPNIPLTSSTTSIETPTVTTPMSYPHALVSPSIGTPMSFPTTSTPGLFAQTPNTPTMTTTPLIQTPTQTVKTPTTGQYSFFSLPEDQQLNPKTPIIGQSAIPKWCFLGASVVVQGANVEDQEGVVESVQTNEHTAVVYLPKDGSRSTISVDNLTRENPEKNDYVKIFDGEHEGEGGELAGIDGNYGIVKMSDDMRIIDLNLLVRCKKD
ncbi:transcription elongation factor spt5 [Anaeramoeba ignava]|uniref:Transcription elongation factor spt5 n=1 Tax=Anaeramoeba ignava TaxID=1746090 RepID=A0A9Q0LHH6_ANAIG|nr:transcription elongation factor spt5 [Anaeramoeba ignava]